MNTAKNMVLEKGASSIPNQEKNSMENYENLYEKKNFSSLDYPVSAYFLDLHKSYMNWIRWH